MVVLRRESNHDYIMIGIFLLALLALLASMWIILEVIVDLENIVLATLSSQDNTSIENSNPTNTTLVANTTALVYPLVTVQVLLSPAAISPVQSAENVPPSNSTPGGVGGAADDHARNPVSR